MATNAHVSRRSLFTAAAAALAGTAGLAAPFPLANSVEPDPIFALIERHRAVYAAHGASLERGCTNDEAQAACDADEAAWRTLLDATPTTVAGAAALARYTVQHVEQLADVDSASEALTALAAALGRLAHRRG